MLTVLSQLEIEIVSRKNKVWFKWCNKGWAYSWKSSFRLFLRDYDNQRELITTILGTNDIVEDVKQDIFR